MEDPGLATASSPPRGLAQGRTGRPFVVTFPVRPWRLASPAAAGAARSQLSAGVDAHSVRRENRPLGVDPQANLVSEIAQLKVSIDRAAAATEITLAGHQPASADDDPRSPPAEHKELCRQLAALRERVALAENRNEGPHALRAELATLEFFARALQADTDNWRSVLEEQMKELGRKKTAARKERESLAADRAKLARRRDALQFTILQTAARMAQQYRGECRRTIPVFTLGEGLTVCSVSVSCPRRGFRFGKQWLVTLTRSHDVLVRRE
jgi:hypothetical protein